MKIEAGQVAATDHKLIGKLYLGTSFGWFLVGGIMAMLIRSELAFPGQQVVNDELYNQLFTMHGTIMLLLFATPLFFGFANVIMPLQIGSPDVAFPRLNMLSYWLFLFGGLIAASGSRSPPVPLTSAGSPMRRSPTLSARRASVATCAPWALRLAGLGTILGAVNFITTIFCMRAPGMTMFRMPIFVWNTLVTSLLVLIAFPVLGGALLSLEADRAFGAHIFDTATGGPILLQHLFLVLRPSRGVHHRAAVLRHRDRGTPGFQPQARLRLHRTGRGNAGDRRACRCPYGRTTCSSPERSTCRSSRE